MAEEILSKPGVEIQRDRNLLTLKPDFFRELFPLLKFYTDKELSPFIDNLFKMKQLFHTFIANYLTITSKLLKNRLNLRHYSSIV